MKNKRDFLELLAVVIGIGGMIGFYSFGVSEGKERCQNELFKKERQLIETEDDITEQQEILQNDRDLFKAEVDNYILNNCDKIATDLCNLTVEDAINGDSLIVEIENLKNIIATLKEEEYKPTPLDKKTPSKKENPIILSLSSNQNIEFKYKSYYNAVVIFDAHSRHTQCIPVHCQQKLATTGMRGR